MNEGLTLLIDNSMKTDNTMLHFGPPNKAKYQMGGDIITQSTEEKDLGITIDEKLKFQIYINNQTKKANQRLGMIKRSFTYMDKNMFTTLFKSIVRPHLEYGSNIWSVMYKKEAIQIESVQRRATKLVKNIQHLSYSDRLIIKLTCNDKNL